MSRPITHHISPLYRADAATAVHINCLSTVVEYGFVPHDWWGPKQYTNVNTDAGFYIG